MFRPPTPIVRVGTLNRKRGMRKQRKKEKDKVIPVLFLN
jgi:hypothetical protein